jgi:hypothetical protein
VLVRDHHLEQRMAGGGSGRRDGVDDHLERQVLVGQRGQVDVAYPGQQLAQRGIARDVRPQHQRVDEEADEPFERIVDPAGYRHTEGDVLPGPEAGEQPGHGGVGDHEGRGAEGAGQL